MARHLRLRGLQQQHHSVVPLHQVPGVACGRHERRIRVHRRPRPRRSLPAVQRGAGYAALLLGCRDTICLAAFLQVGNIRVLSGLKPVIQMLHSQASVCLDTNPGISASTFLTQTHARHSPPQCRMMGGLPWGRRSRGRAHRPAIPALRLVGA